MEERRVWEAGNGGGLRKEQRNESTGRREAFEEEERRALYLLSNIEGMHSGVLRRMLAFAGSYGEAYRIPAGVYEAEGILGAGKNGRPLLLQFDRRREAEDRLLKAYESLSAEGIRLVSSFDEHYPKRLRSLPNRPELLYVKGRLPSDERPCAAIIGARMCSDYGRETAAYFASELAEAGMQILSGMAMGIDGAAQAAALKTAGESFAVLGSGIDICYPREHIRMYLRMAEGEGGVISEYPKGCPPLPYHFILRNRIISGLCDVLLVLEAREKSGTGITVNYALDQGKEIFALPGRINDPLGRGANALLKDGAQILTSPEDVLSLFGLTEKMQSRDRGQKAAALAKQEKIVYSNLDSREQHIELLSKKTGLEITALLDALLRLELMGLAASPMNGYYRRKE